MTMVFDKTQSITTWNCVWQTYTWVELSRVPAGGLFRAQMTSTLHIYSTARASMWKTKFLWNEGTRPHIHSVFPIVRFQFRIFQASRLEKIVWRVCHNWGGLIPCSRTSGRHGMKRLTYHWSSEKDKYWATVSQAVTPRGEPALDFIQTLHVHWLQNLRNHSNVAPTIHGRA